MPHYLIIKTSEQSSQFIGMCEFTKRRELEPKIEALCKAMGWNLLDIKWLHVYDNCISNSFEYF